VPAKEFANVGGTRVVGGNAARQGAAGHG
jgi:hypothetical protein